MIADYGVQPFSLKQLKEKNTKFCSLHVFLVQFSK